MASSLGKYTWCRLLSLDVAYGFVRITRPRMASITIIYSSPGNNRSLNVSPTGLAEIESSHKREEESTKYVECNWSIQSSNETVRVPKRNVNVRVRIRVRYRHQHK